MEKILNTPAEKLLESADGYGRTRHAIEPLQTDSTFGWNGKNRQASDLPWLKSAS